MIMIFIPSHEMPQMNGFWDISIFMAPICKHFRAKKNRVQNLSGKHSWSLKTLIFFFCQIPTLFRPKNGTLRANLRVSCYWKFVLGILGRIKKKLLNSFWEKHCFMWKMAIFTPLSESINKIILMHSNVF